MKNHYNWQRPHFLAPSILFCFVVVSMIHLMHVSHYVKWLFCMRADIKLLKPAVCRVIWKLISVSDFNVTSSFLCANQFSSNATFFPFSNTRKKTCFPLLFWVLWLLSPCEFLINESKCDRKHGFSNLIIAINKIVQRASRHSQIWLSTYISWMIKSMRDVNNELVQSCCHTGLMCSTDCPEDMLS